MSQVAYPLANQAYKLGLAIEDLPAGEEQTKPSIQCGAIIDAISQYEAKRNTMFIPEVQVKCDTNMLRDLLVKNGAVFADSPQGIRDGIQQLVGELSRTNKMLASA